MYVEVVETQNTIIRLQSEVIKELFDELLKHVSCEDADKLPAVRKINLAAELRNNVKI